MGAFNRLNCAALDILEDAAEIYRAIDKMYRENLPLNNENVDKSVKDKVKEKICEVMDDINAFLRQNAGLFSKSGTPVQFEFERVKNIIGNCFTDNHSSLRKMATLEKFLSMIEVNVYILQNMPRILAHDRCYGRYGVLQTVIERTTGPAKAALERNDLRYEDVAVADIHELIIYGNLSTIGCRLHGHKITHDRKQYPNFENGHILDLPVHHCLTCGKIFMGSETYKVFSDIYVMSLPERKDIVQQEDETDDNIFDVFEPESPLHKRGYNVRSNGPSDRQRHAILVDVLERGEMEYVQIDALLDSNIKLRKNMRNAASAVKKWRDDLKFLGEYIKSKHPL